MLPVIFMLLNFYLSNNSIVILLYRTFSFLFLMKEKTNLKILKNSILILIWTNSSVKLSWNIFFKLMCKGNLILYNFWFGVLGEESIKYFHFEAKNFEHFEYVYDLTRNYTQNNEIQPEDIIIKIGVVGKFTDDNLNLFPKGNVVRRKLCILVNARLMGNELMVYRGQYIWRQTYSLDVKK